MSFLIRLISSILSKPGLGYLFASSSIAWALAVTVAVLVVVVLSVVVQV